ncbi:androglobin-like [Colletes gigas]|uniref:androglobin-like n=1 Tax=Colletes gigas TaxID=935657 RepID=UPI001C9AF25C|nr:androglobin-like [Colletes gigas]
MIPVNLEGLPVLPRTANDYELWPMILSKALLKLCSLTWTQQREIVDFHPVTCLTGWVCLQLEIDYLSPKDKWDFLRKYADHFEWETEATEHASRSKISSDGKPSKDTVRTKKSKNTERSKKTKSTERSKTSKESGRTKKSKNIVQKPTVLSKPQPVTLFLGLDDMKTLSSETVPGLSPCWNHFIYVAQSRDIPLDSKDVKPPLARWKIYRWLKWAIDEGIIDPVDYFVPIRSLKIVSPLKSFERSIVNRFSDATPEEPSQNEDIDNKKKKHRDRSKESTKTTSKGSQKKTPDDPPVDTSFWVDFNKMEPYVKDVHFFYKLDYFQYTAKISDRLIGRRLLDHQSEAKKGSKRSSPTREPEFIDAHCWPQKMSETRNEPLYIFTDSLEEKFFLISFSTFQVSVDNPATVPTLGEGDSETPPVANWDYLIVEKHSWFYRPKRSNSLVYILTAGTKSTVMELKSGRHLLRVYCRSESSCFVTISSDTVFRLGDRKRMYQLMSTESETIDQLAKHISNSVSSAYQSFGTERYLEALTIYYNCYMPPVQNLKNKNKVFYNHIHDCFIDEQVQLIRKILPVDQVPDVLWSLRVFFLNPAIGLQCLNPISTMLRNMRKSNVPKYSLDRGVLDENSAAVVIQSFFKTLLIRKYKQIHDPGHQQHQRVLENLARATELFNYNKRESIANQLLRNILRHFDRLQDIYPCSRDFEYTLQLQELTGTLANVKPNQWLPIVRFTVNSPTMKTVFAGVDLFVGLPRFSVRVFNNETGGEMLRTVNNVVPTRYQYTPLGYTIIGYGWSGVEAFKELPWTMNVITMKGQPVFYSLNDEMTHLPLLVTEELSDIYVPNADKRVSRWIVRVAKPSVLSFRLRTSYEKAKIVFRVTDEEGNVLSQIKGTSVVILPVIHLGLQPELSQMQFKAEKIKGSANNDRLSYEDGSENIEEDESKVSQESMGHRTYHAEAFVLNDSWPLTKPEWAAVMEVKAKVTVSLLKTKSSTVSIAGRSSKTEATRTRKGSRQANDGGQLPESPYWVLQVVADFGSDIEVLQDRTKEKQIVEMKEAWSRENPDSLQRGRELREAFIAEHEIKQESSTVNVIRKSSIHVGRSSTKRDSKTIDCCLEILASKMEARTERPFHLHRLPTLNLSDYKIKEEEEDTPWVKTPHDEEVLSNIRKMNIVYAKEDYSHVLEEMDGLLQSRVERYRELFSKHKDSFWERRALLEDVYEARKSYIGTTKPVSVRSSKKSARSKKSTKSKRI